jgi:outer membrane protein TolC
MKNHRKYLIILAGFMLILPAITAASQDQDPLDRYLEMAARNNSGLQSLFIQYHAALERIPQAGTLPDPTAMFSYFIMPVETRVGAQRAGISLTQAFPWFGQLGAREQAAADRAKASYEIFAEAKNKLFFEVKTAYFDLYVLRAATSITEKNIRFLETYRELANIKLESGKGSAVDLLRVEMDLAELENQLGFLADSREPIYARFRELLNLDTLTDIQIPDTLERTAPDESKMALFDSIRFNNPRLKQIDHEISSLESEMDVAGKMGLPSFSLGLSYTFISPRNDMEIADNGKDALIFPQVGVRLPLYRNKYRAMIREKEFLKEAKTAERESKEDRLNSELENVWRDYLDASRRIELYIHLRDLASQSLDLLVTQYTTAGKDFEEILRMDRQLLRYELELEKARADQNTYAAYINYLTGK